MFATSWVMANKMHSYLLRQGNTHFCRVEANHSIKNRKRLNRCLTFSLNLKFSGLMLSLVSPMGVNVSVFPQGPKGVLDGIQDSKKISYLLLQLSAYRPRKIHRLSMKKKKKKKHISSHPRSNQSEGTFRSYGFVCGNNDYDKERQTVKKHLFTLYVSLYKHNTHIIRNENIPQQEHDSKTTLN